MTNRNVQFLSMIDSRTKAVILESSSAHYGITPQEAYAEVTDAQAEHLLDYMIEPPATSALMRRHGIHR
ncbi:hypothetical protein ACIQVE_01755 [Pseudomonas sp. NPDC098747]|uniref:hypothetical protein n=1 Tax=Pseudomonas sp. NPDC098747 TaxID=3364487 RepID=UPI00383B8981